MQDICHIILVYSQHIKRVPQGEHIRESTSIMQDIFHIILVYSQHIKRVPQGEHIRRNVGMAEEKKYSKTRNERKTLIIYNV